MALKIELKANERVIIGEHAIVNASDRRIKLVVETKARILRQSEILPELEARTVCDRLQVVLQRMYLARDPAPHQADFLRIAGEIVAAVPSFGPKIAAISGHILAGEMYQALKGARALREDEAALLELARVALAGPDAASA
ncbi:hypothetical protein IP69_15345 [Bosea sp. AAP35]|uniref:flagellar biosynthesis repressor FlbT n=1 Tax=Bosea sp. AAP35 TaxID=1523417 RepID=UPI0006B92B7C|nr:flagellar biosynthesis repressor FlbT [Bosea sp. AAP35]KPF66245.1 hypothetical protein IP69_15345 [Bosea sp. AAP35]